MRVTSSELRDLVRTGPGWRLPQEKKGGTNPHGIRNKAISIYHNEGHAAALAYLAGNRDGSKGLSGKFGAGGPYEEWGRRTRRALDRYFQYDQQLGDEYAALPLRAEVQVGSHVIGAGVDVVMFNDSGYTGRLLNWDRGGVSLEAAELIAIPAALLIEQELGHGTCVKIAVWDLEHVEFYEIDGAYALAQLGELRQLMNRVEAAF